MSSVVPQITGSAITMTSLELVDFVNGQRGDGEPSLRHDHFLAKVPRVLGEDHAPKFRDMVLVAIGSGAKRLSQIYRFPKREACLMAMSYSYEIQAKVYDRMTALEHQVAAAISLDDPSALRAALLGYTEKVLMLETTVKAQAPKVEFADALLNADGTTLVRDVAKTIGVGVRPFEKALREKGVILPNNAPAAQYVSRGYFKEDTHPYETKTRGTQISHTARVTGKGIEFIRRFVQRHAGLLGHQTGAA